MPLYREWASDPYSLAAIWKIEKLQNKFLSPEEQVFFRNDPKLITLAWSAKEAVYKWQGRRGVDFIEHLPVTKIEENGRDINIIIYCQLIREKMNILSKGNLEEDFSLSYVVHDKIFHPY